MEENKKVCNGKNEEPLGTSVAKAVSGFFALSVAFVSLGCSASSNKPAPEPTENAHPRIFSKFRVKVDNPLVDDLEAQSVWSIHNFRCAPQNPVSGALNVGQPNTPEIVARIGPSEYEVSVVEDRFALDDCHWTRGGTQFRFMHKGEIFASYTNGVEKSPVEIVHGVICQPRTRWTGFCFLPENLPPKVAAQPGLFKAEVDVLPTVEAKNAARTSGQR